MPSAKYRDGTHSQGERLDFDMYLSASETVNAHQLKIIVSALIDFI